MKYLRYGGAIFVVGVALVVCAFLLLKMVAEHQLHALGDSEFEAIQIQPHVDRPLKTVSDKEILKAIQRSIQHGQVADIASYPPTSCQFIIHYDDGRNVRLRINPIGKSKIKMADIRDNQGSTRRYYPGYIVLKYRKNLYTIDSEPFIDELVKVLDRE